MPRRVALSLGGLLGSLGRWLLPGRARIARKNLLQAIPEYSPAEREAILRQMFRHLGTGFVEMLRLDLSKNEAQMQRDYVISGEEHIKQALAEGRGCILLTGHIGFWEAGNFIFSKMGYPIGVVAKPMHNPLTDRYFIRMREAAGGYIINSRKGARRMLKSLQKNHLLGILIDQHVGRRHGVQVPFFGRMAWTTPVIAELAMKYRVPVVPTFCWWLPGNRYHLEIAPAIMLTGETTPERVLENTALLTQVIEDAVRRDPSQWFWVHRRWR